SCSVTVIGGWDAQDTHRRRGSAFARMLAALIALSFWGFVSLSTTRPPELGVEILGLDNAELVRHEPRGDKVMLIYQFIIGKGRRREERPSFLMFVYSGRWIFLDQTARKAQRTQEPIQLAVGKFGSFHDRTGGLWLPLL